MWQITVDDDKCTGCGECVDSCPGEVYELKDGKAVPVNVDECHGCHTCEAVCDEDACHVEDDE
jgi:NAD-dependent dihydropyrimidine dehydrogenase PreA subunit